MRCLNVILLKTHLQLGLSPKLQNMMMQRRDIIIIFLRVFKEFPSLKLLPMQALSFTKLLGLV